MRLLATTTAAFLFSSAANSSRHLACFTHVSPPRRTYTSSSSSFSSNNRAEEAGRRRTTTTAIARVSGPLDASPTPSSSSSSLEEKEEEEDDRSSGRMRGNVVGSPPSSPPPSSSATTPANNGSPLSTMVSSQRQFEMNLGRSIDALKRDYPDLLTKDPCWEIYHPRIEVVNPTGVRMTGLENYRMALRARGDEVVLLRGTQRHDERQGRVRLGEEMHSVPFDIFFIVSWNVELVPKMIYGGTRNTLHVDGISEYHLDRESGLITDHRITRLLINDQAVRPANGIFRALAELATPGIGINNPDGVPVFSVPTTTSIPPPNAAAATMVEFRTWSDRTSSSSSSSSSSLFSNPNERESSSSSDVSDMGFSHAPYDRDALRRKNESRKKFGKPPLTPEEFVIIEEEVRAMDLTNKKKAAYLAEQLAQRSAEGNKKKKEDSFLSNIFGGVFKNGCESNFDCERPQVCCDVGFKRICCSNGLGIVDGVPVERYERGLLRVPLPNDNYDY
ncbi:hypothetical protein ACHAW5_007992 [Stephanodiscus triporus]|uniref:Uncharacterized protein n=1 Tax=Stephanodiscus triporus TaxID=2934178 RepID=A0ABD3PK17_9STRA